MSDYDDFKNKLNDLSKKINIELTNEQVEKYFDYMNLLLEWNNKINLTAITEIDDIILKHFIDSMTVLKYINNNEEIIDVGTGAGFPGIPISIMCITENRSQMCKSYIIGFFK